MIVRNVTNNVMVVIVINDGRFDKFVAYIYIYIHVSCFMHKKNKSTKK